MPREKDAPWLVRADDFPFTFASRASRAQEVPPQPPAALKAAPGRRSPRAGSGHCGSQRARATWPPGPASALGEGPTPPHGAGGTCVQASHVTTTVRVTWPGVSPTHGRAWLLSGGAAASRCPPPTPGVSLPSFYSSVTHEAPKPKGNMTTSCLHQTSWREEDIKRSQRVIASVNGREVVVFYYEKKFYALDSRCYRYQWTAMHYLSLA
ncbi:Rieske domain-containing protein isoform X3 [Alligator mississippiensis]|uniref:Rieske domain-containing protein isoform X3 n=1 Tax=Alligator mississippiensis TaxID=8496 RepID=UPI002877A893|nr:Rieske domain-containing protein isoform X3 [Alligator mississippiensis]